MTARQLYEGVLIELNKENAPNVLLEDFNYFANKAVNNYVNKRYNIYEIKQQTTDDLRVLKATALLEPEQVTDKYLGMTMAGDGKMATYEVIMPSDYLHILNCICIYRVEKTYKCYNKGDSWRAPATRLTADMYSQVLDNFWNKPTYKRPYYYIHNVNKFDVDSNGGQGDEPVVDPETNQQEQSNSSNSTTIDTVFTSPQNPTNPYNKETGKGTDVQDVTTMNLNPKDSGYTAANGNTPASGTSYGNDGLGKTIVSGNGLPDSIKIGSVLNASLRERGQGIRYGNVSQVRLEIRYGTDNSVFKLKKVYVDYIKAPQNIRLTQQEIDLTEDTSQMLEYPDYVCQEIINELVHLIMENISDQRLQTHPVVSQSIANPAQAQAPAQGQSAQ